MMKTYNLYCDESTHIEHDEHPYMLLSYVSIPYHQLKIHKEYLKDLKERHNFYSEIKWSKVSHSKQEFYLELVDYFFSTDILFRAVVVEKNKIRNHAFDQDYNTFYYKMYYQLIHHKIDMSANYNIYLDIKDDLSRLKIRKLKEILNYNYGVIRNLQSIHSKESIFMQLTDFLMGAVNYRLRGLSKVTTKIHIIEKIEKECGHSLCIPTLPSEQKFNLFFIDLK
ncbi:MAG: DUF3800 domain-containing protein [Melioribacteraceae bacterium]|nr:MAG: DUF3800 domain-containing protein [Melioribacteraceae bacterium]